MDLKDHIRGIPDFPKPGIFFYDISTLLSDPKAWRYCISQLSETVGDLEYGADTIEIQADAITAGDKVVVMDDLLATGGTAAATIELLHQVDADVLSASFIIELAFLKGRDKLSIPANSLVTYND